MGKDLFHLVDARFRLVLVTGLKWPCLPIGIFLRFWHVDRRRSSQISPSPVPIKSFLYRNDTASGGASVINISGSLLSISPFPNFSTALLCFRAATAEE
jgi:hypothetical protein